MLEELKKMFDGCIVTLLRFDIEETGYDAKEVGMLDKIKLWVMEKLVSKYLLGYAVLAWRKLAGYKTGFCVTLMVAVYIAQLLGYLDPETARSTMEKLEVAAGFSLLEKFARYQGLFEKGVAQVRDKAKESV